jgi:hypothetical protein
MRAALLILALAATALAADSGPVVVKTTAEPARTTIGTPIRYTIEVTADADVEVIVDQPTEHVGDLDIIDFGFEPKRTVGGKVVISRWFSLVGWKPGEVELPAPGVRWQREQAEPEAAATSPTKVTIESVLATVPDAADIRDIKGVEAAPADLRPLYLLAALLLIGLAVAWFVRRWRNRPSRPQPVAPPPPAHVVAAQALAELSRRRLPHAGAFVEHYTALAAIVRTYVEQRFGLRAPEMTTQEFLGVSARDARLAGSHRGLLGQFLGECDQVKFARHVPTVNDGERALAAATRFVEETAEREAPEAMRAAG